MQKYIFLLTITLFPFAHYSLAGDIVGNVTTKGARDNSNAVVYVKHIEGKALKVPKEHAMMDQRNLKFVPHVLPIQVGTTVEFRNSDDVLHNVFTPSRAGDKFNLGTWGKGKVKTYTFNRLGEVVLLCNIHPEMEAFIVVLPMPYFAKTNKEGHYIIENVPPGNYVLKVWHEKLRRSVPKEIAVIVPETGEIEVSFELSR